METFKGTKGPWHLSVPSFKGKWAGFNTQQGECYGIYATNDDLEAIAMVPKDDWLVHSNQNVLANAKLISFAPDMLELLDEISNSSYVTIRSDDLKEKIRTLIKHATS